MTPGEEVLDAALASSLARKLGASLSNNDSADEKLTSVSSVSLTDIFGDVDEYEE
jgi:hypothetical protein